MATKIPELAPPPGDWPWGSSFRFTVELSVQQIISAIFRGGILKLPTSILEPWGNVVNRNRKPDVPLGIRNMDSLILVWYHHHWFGTIYSNWFGDFWYLCYPFLVCVISFDSSCFDYYCCVGMPQIKNSRKQVWMSALAAASSVDKLKGTSSAMYSDLDMLISLEM